MAAMARRWNKTPWKDWPRWPDKPPVQYTKAPEVEEPLPPAESTEKSSWVGFQVVWDENDTPVADVSLVVEHRATSRRNDVTILETSADGRVRLETQPTGSEVRCAFNGLTAEQCVEYVGLGEATRPAGAEQKDASRPSSSPMAIVRVERHRVRTGETLRSIASDAGLTWNDLALFNFGTKDPQKVEKHLAADVGCTKKDPSGDGLVFDDADWPGLLLVPRQWRLPGMAHAQEHKVRVRPLRPAGFIRLRLNLGPAAVAQFRLFTECGTFEQVKHLEDDLLAGDDFVDLEFSGCPAGRSFTLEAAKDGGEPVRLFEGVSFGELHGDFERA